MLLAVQGLAWVDWGSDGHANASSADDHGDGSPGHSRVDDNRAGLAACDCGAVGGVVSAGRVHGRHEASGALTMFQIFVEACRALLGVLAVVGCVGLLVGLIVAGGGE